MNHTMAANMAAEIHFFLQMIDICVVDVLYIVILLIILLHDDV